MVSKCYCCDNGEEEKLNCLFLTAPIAQKLWKQFSSYADISIEGLHLQQLITTQWNCPGKHKLRRILKVVPAIIMWELWKKRNAGRHGKEVTLARMVVQCQNTIKLLIKVKYQWLVICGHEWKEMVFQLQAYTPKLHYILVKWIPPNVGWVKRNIKETLDKVHMD